MDAIEVRVEAEVQGMAYGIESHSGRAGRICVRLATIWAVLVLSWAIILSINVAHVLSHGEWFPILGVALGPLALASAIIWAFAAPLK